MRKITLTLLVSIFVSILTFAQVKVTINVYANSVKESEKVFIAGNHTQLGEWIPNRIVLEQIDSVLWMKTFLFNKNEFIEFKFTKGDWSKEALTNDKTVPPNHKLTVINDTVLTFKINYWKDEFRISVPDYMNRNMYDH